MKMNVNSQYKQSGYSLVEVLVATVIIAVGILGIAGLQVISIQQNRSALFRAEATKHAANILDRIRVNKLVAYGPVTLADAPATSLNCRDTGTAASSCTRDQMKTFDLTWWKCSINQLNADGTLISACDALGFKLTDNHLPDGKGSITSTTATVHTATLKLYEVTVEWTDDAQGNAASITVRAQVN